MKKYLALFMAAAMMLTAFAGCTIPGGNDPSVNEGTEETEKDSEEAADISTDGDDEAWTGEIEPIVVVALNGGTENPFLDQVAEKLNDYIRDKIGVEVSFRQASIFDAASQYTMWLGSGEAIDLLPIAFVPVSAFSGMNMLEPMEDLLQYAPHITELADAGMAVYAPSADGHLYGISTLEPVSGNGAGMWFFAEDLKEAGLDTQYQDNQLVTLEEIDQIVRKVHELHPESYVGVYGSAPRSGFTFEYDPLGADISSGVILGTDSTEVVNYFETDAYKAYIDLHRQWYLDGLVKKDAATMDALESGSMTNDTENCRMMWNDYNLGIIDQLETSSGKDVVALRVAKANQRALTDSGLYTGIPVTSEHPEAAMRFMDLMYSDQIVENYLFLGIEGVNYDYTDDTRMAIIPNSENSFYAITCGDRNLEPMTGVYDPDRAEKIEQFAAEVAANPTKGYGFMYNPSAMTNQITAIDAVMQEYRAALETGSADVDTVYPEFINKLKANGIDEVIADKQAQFDAWLQGK